MTPVHQAHQRMKMTTEELRAKRERGTKPRRRKEKMLKTQMRQEGSPTEDRSIRFSSLIRLSY